MENYLTRLNELRKDYPVAGYIMIIALAAMIVLTIVQLAAGSYVPLIIGCVLLFFFLFVIIVFSNALKSRSKGFHFFLSATMLSVISAIFVVWLVLLTLAAFNFICVSWMSHDCKSSSEVTIDGYLQPTYSVIQNDTKSVPFEHYRSSCEDRSYGSHRVCLPDGFHVTGANTEGFWAKNNNGTLGTPVTDPQNPGCAVVEWSAASGGRTGLGECRYHGHIKFTMNVHGEKTTIEQGQRFDFSELSKMKERYAITYPNNQPSNASSVAWEYSLQIARENDLLERILAWWSNSTLWTAQHVSSVTPKDACLSSAVQGHALIAVVDC